ncbi:MAG: cell envelope integrity protein TolA [Thermoanaerobaculia bacterium]|nr:cell envelope integrity protein TolA [Thermoanaerobaculia bacterium]
MTVSEVLEERNRRPDAPHGLAVALSLAAHAAFVVFLVLISQPRKLTTPPLMSLPVRVVSPGALARLSGPPGRPAARPQAEAPPKRVIEKIRDEAPAPSAEALPLPGKPKKGEAPKPAPRASAPGPRPAATDSAVELPSAGNGGLGGSGSPGLSSFGASLSGFDSDFPFSYYAEQIQALIGANWLKPDVAEGTACVVTFRIQRSGQVTDVKVETSSGLAFYDRAAARAIYSANPLPPLPPEFRGEQLGVHIRFQ